MVNQPSWRRMPQIRVAVRSVNGAYAENSSAKQTWCYWEKSERINVTYVCHRFLKLHVAVINLFKNECLL